jgi:GT2 family glycosyltransferase
MTTPRVSAVVLAWQAEPWLRRCVESLLESEKVDVDVVLVDNGCTTDDVSLLERLPGVSVVRPGRNLGFAGGCNAGAAVATGEFVALVNGDAVVEPGTLARLVEEAGQPQIGIAVASVRLAEDPRLINAGANPVHILGLSWSGRMGEVETRTAPVPTAGASGACLVIRRGLWDQLGGFDDAYFAYHEDVELSVRIWRMGLQVVYVPDAIAVHRYEFSRNAFKLYLIERNRLMFVLTTWSVRALVVLAPLLLGLDAAMLLLAARQGWAREKVRGWQWLWQHRHHIRARRRELATERTVPDREWMGMLTDRLDTVAVALPAGTGLLNALVHTYWQFARRMV